MIHDRRDIFFTIADALSTLPADNWDNQGPLVPWAQPHAILMGPLHTEPLYFGPYPIQHRYRVTSPNYGQLQHLFIVSIYHPHYGP